MLIWGLQFFCEDFHVQPILFERHSIFINKIACSIIPVRYRFLYFSEYFLAQFTLIFLPSELTTVTTSPPLVLSPLSPHTITSSAVASFNCFAKLFPFLLVDFGAPRDIVYLLTVATRAVTHFTVTYTATFFDFYSLFNLLCRSDYCDYDAPLFLDFLLPRFSIILGFDTMRIDLCKFDVNSSFSFNGLYLTFGLTDIFLL